MNPTSNYIFFFSTIIARIPLHERIASAGLCVCIVLLRAHNNGSDNDDEDDDEDSDNDDDNPVNCD